MSSSNPNIQPHLTVSAVPKRRIEGSEGRVEVSEGHIEVTGGHTATTSTPKTIVLPTARSHILSTQSSQNEERVVILPASVNVSIAAVGLKDSTAGSGSCEPLLSGSDPLAATDPWSGGPPVRGTAPGGGHGSTEGGEEKNIFSSLNLNPETLFKIEEVLSGTNEGQLILKEGLGQVPATGKDIMDDTALSLKIDESADLDFVLDESMIAESLNAGNLSAIASAFAADHAYASTPGRNTPAPLAMETIKDQDSDNDENLSRSIDSDGHMNSESELNTSRDEREDHMTGDDSQEDGSLRGSRGRHRRGGHAGSRRSTRVQEISQRQEAEKIMAENLEKERAALENLQKLRPGEKIPVVKSYNMRIGRSRRDDGRIDYTKLAKGQGRVLVSGEEGNEADGSFAENDGGEEETVATPEGEEQELGEQQTMEGGDSNDETSSLMSSPVKISINMKKIRSQIKIQTDSENTGPNDSLDSIEVTEYRGRGRGGRGRGRGSGTRGRGRARGRGGVPRSGTPKGSDEEGSGNEAKPATRGTRSRGRPRGVTSAGRGRSRGRGGGITRKLLSDPALSPSDSDDQSIASLKKKKTKKKSVKSKINKTEKEDRSDVDSAEGKRENSDGSSSSEDEAPLKQLVQKIKTKKSEVVQSTADDENDEDDSSDDMPLSKLKASKSPITPHKKVSKYEADSDYAASPQASDVEELECEDNVKDSIHEDDAELSSSATGSQQMASKSTGISTSSNTSAVLVSFQGTSKTERAIKDRDPFDLSSSAYEEESENSMSEVSTDYNDPKKRWCICRKPWQNRFMICCDKCLDWFHGSCVGVSMKAGKKNRHWICPRCIKEETSIKTKKKSHSKEAVKDKATPGAKSVKLAQKVVKKELKVRLEELPKESQESSLDTTDDTDLMIAESTDESLPVKTKQKPAKERHKQEEEVTTKQEVEDEEEVDSQQEVTETKKEVEKVVHAPKKKKEKKQDPDEDIIDAIFGTSEEDGDDALDEDFVKEPGEEDGSKVTKNDSTESIVKKAEKNKEKVKDLKKQLESVKAKREKKESKQKEREIIEGEKRKEAERVDRAKKEVERRERERNQAKESEHVSSKDRCIAPGCRKRKQGNSVYCGERCIESHATQSLEMLREERDKMFGFKSQGSCATERIVVLERLSGKILTGPAAPTEGSLKSWLVKHPSYEVLQPGQNPGNAAAKKKESKEKEEKRREMALIKEKREKREREAAERKVKEQAEREKREKEKEREREREKEREKERLIRREKERSRMEEHSGPSSGPDPLRISVRKALRDALDKRANDSDDIMLSGAEIKKVALDIEGELFNYYRDTSNPKYRNKYRTIQYYIKEQRNQGFFRRILNGLIKPYKLVRLSAEQLGSPEYAKWQEEKPKSTPEKEDPLSQHQTGLVFEKFDPPVKPRTSKPKPSTDTTKTSSTDKPGYNQPVQHYESAADIFSSIIVDTTAGHSKHLFDVNCKICTGRQTEGPSVKAEPPQKKHKTEEESSGQSPLTVQTSAYSGFGAQYYGASPSSPNSPAAAYPTVKSEHANAKHDLFGGESSSGFTGFYEQTKPDKEHTKDENHSTTAKQEKSSSSSAAPNDPRKSRDPRSDPRGDPRDPRRRGREKEQSEIKSEPHSGPVAAGPLVDKTTSSEVLVKEKLLPDGYIWRGHLYVQDMCNLKCMAMPVSGPTDTLKEDMPDTISVVGRLSPPQIWDYLGRLKNSSSRVIVVVSFQPMMEDTLAYHGLFEYLRGKDRCGLLAQFSQKIKDFYLIPLASDSPVPDALMPFNGPGLWVNRPNMLLGVMVMLASKRHKDIQPKELKPVIKIKQEKSAVKEEAETGQKEAAPHFFYGERKDSLTDMDLHVPPAIKKIKPEKHHREKTRKRSVKTEEGSSPPSSVAEEEDKGKDVSKPPLKQESTAETTKSVLDKLKQMNKPGVSKEEMAAAVVASLAASTQTKSLDEQKRLLAELTAKVEEQKRFLEQQREKTIRENQKADEESAKGSNSSLAENILDNIPLPGAAPPLAKDSKNGNKTSAKVETKTEQTFKTDDQNSDNSDDEITPKFFIPEREIRPYSASQMSDNKGSLDSGVDSNAFNLARHRLLKKTGGFEDAFKLPQAPGQDIPVGVPPVGVPPVTPSSATLAPVIPVSASTTPAANITALPEAVQKLLSGPSFENLKNIVAKATSKDSEGAAIISKGQFDKTESGEIPKFTTSGKTKAAMLDREEGEIDDDEIDNELELALDGNPSDDDVQIIRESPVKSSRDKDHGSSPDSQDRRRRRKRRRRDSENRRDRRRDHRRSGSQDRKSRRHRDRSRDRTQRDNRSSREISQDPDQTGKRSTSPNKQPGESVSVTGSEMSSLDGQSVESSEHLLSPEKRKRKSRFDEPMINTSGDVDYRVEARQRQLQNQPNDMGNQPPQNRNEGFMGGQKQRDSEGPSASGPQWPMAPMSEEEFKNWEKAQQALRLINSHKQLQQIQQPQQQRAGTPVEDEGDDMVISDQDDGPEGQPSILTESHGPPMTHPFREGLPPPPGHRDGLPPPPGHRDGLPPPPGKMGDSPMMFDHPFSHPPPGMDIHGMRMPPPSMLQGGMMRPPLRMMRPPGPGMEMFRMMGRPPPPHPNQPPGFGPDGRGPRMMGPPGPLGMMGPRMGFRPPMEPGFRPPVSGAHMQGPQGPPSTERRTLLPTPNLPPLPSEKSDERKTEIRDRTSEERQLEGQQKPPTSQAGNLLQSKTQIPSIFDLDIQLPPSEPKCESTIPGQNRSSDQKSKPDGDSACENIHQRSSTDDKKGDGSVPKPGQNKYRNEAEHGSPSRETPANDNRYGSRREDQDRDLRFPDRRDNWRNRTEDRRSGDQDRRSGDHRENPSQDRSRRFDERNPRSQRRFSPHRRSRSPSGTKDRRQRSRSPSGNKDRKRRSRSPLGARDTRQRDGDRRSARSPIDRKKNDSKRRSADRGSRSERRDTKSDTAKSSSMDKSNSTTADSKSSSTSLTVSKTSVTTAVTPSSKSVTTTSSSCNTTIITSTISKTITVAGRTITLMRNVTTSTPANTTYKSTQAVASTSASTSTVASTPPITSTTSTLTESSTPSEMDTSKISDLKTVVSALVKESQTSSSGGIDSRRSSTDSSQGVSAPQDGATGQSASSKRRRKRKGKGPDYVFTKEEELSTTPGVLGPLLAFIRGDDPKPEDVAAVKEVTAKTDETQAKTCDIAAKTDDVKTKGGDTVIKAKSESKASGINSKDKTTDAKSSPGDKLNIGLPPVIKFKLPEQTSKMDTSSAEATSATATVAKQSGWCAAVDWGGKSKTQNNSDSSNNKTDANKGDIVAPGAKSDVGSCKTDSAEKVQGNKLLDANVKSVKTDIKPDDSTSSLSKTNEGLSEQDISEIEKELASEKSKTERSSSRSNEGSRDQRSGSRDIKRRRSRSRDRRRSSKERTTKRSRSRDRSRRSRSRDRQRSRSPDSSTKRRLAGDRDRRGGARGLWDRDDNSRRNKFETEKRENRFQRDADDNNRGRHHRDDVRSRHDRETDDTRLRGKFENDDRNRSERDNERQGNRSERNNNEDSRNPMLERGSDGTQGRFEQESEEDRIGSREEAHRQFQRYADRQTGRFSRFSKQEINEGQMGENEGQIGRRIQGEGQIGERQRHASDEKQKHLVGEKPNDNTQSTAIDDQLKALRAEFNSPPLQPSVSPALPVSEMTRQQHPLGSGVYHPHLQRPPSFDRIALLGHPDEIGRNSPFSEGRPERPESSHSSTSSRPSVDVAGRQPPPDRQPVNWGVGRQMAENDGRSSLMVDRQMGENDGRSPMDNSRQMVDMDGRPPHEYYLKKKEEADKKWVMFEKQDRNFDQPSDEQEGANFPRRPNFEQEKPPPPFIHDRNFDRPDEPSRQFARPPFDQERHFENRPPPTFEHERNFDHKQQQERNFERPFSGGGARNEQRIPPPQPHFQPDRQPLLTQPPPDDVLSGRDVLLQRFREEGEEIQGSGSPFEGERPGKPPPGRDNFPRPRNREVEIFPHMPPQPDDARGAPPPPQRSGLLGDRPSSGEDNIGGPRPSLRNKPRDNFELEQQQRPEFVGGRDRNQPPPSLFSLRFQDDRPLPGDGERPLPHNHPERGDIRRFEGRLELETDPDLPPSDGLLGEPPPGLPRLRNNPNEEPRNISPFESNRRHGPPRDVIVRNLPDDHPARRNPDELQGGPPRSLLDPDEISRFRDRRIVVSSSSQDDEQQQQSHLRNQGRSQPLLDRVIIPEDSELEHTIRGPRSQQPLLDHPPPPEFFANRGRRPLLEDRDISPPPPRRFHDDEMMMDDDFVETSEMHHHHQRMGPPRGMMPPRGPLMRPPHIRGPPPHLRGGPRPPGVGHRMPFMRGGGPRPPFMRGPPPNM